MAASRDPFIGPRPFGREDGSLFFGREREANDLLSLVIAHPAVLLYAQSGAGKTSLLQAKLLPMLEERGSQVLGPVRVGGSLPAGTSIGEVPNVFLYNALATLGASAAAGVPCSSLGTVLTSWPRPAGVVRRILVFDQFEELFTAFPDRWSDRGAVFEQIGEALEEDPRLRVVFAMREEYIAAVDPYVGLLPERLRTRFRLERLRREAALQAVKGPLKGTGRTFGPGAAEKLVDNLLKVPVQESEATPPEGVAEFVEPVHLQVVCQSLWRSLPSGDAPIDEGLIDEYADVDQALSDFYEDCLRRTTKETGAREGALRRWFGQTLITPQGTRGLVYKGAKTTGGLLNEAAKALEDLHLLRVEIRAGATWYELAHDRLIEPIRRSNARWYAERSGAGQLYESRAERWVEGGRRPQDLLPDVEAEQAVAWLGSPEAEELDASETLRDFIETSQEQAVRLHAEKTARIARRQRFQILALAVGLLAAVLSAVYTFRAQRRAEDATLVERGNVAKYLVKRGDLFDAAVFGIRAVSPRATSGRDVPPEALEGLRLAVESLGVSPWLKPEKESIHEVALSLDGRLAAVREPDGFSIWDATEGKQLSREAVFVDLPDDLKFSPGGHYVWMSREYGNTRIWDASTGREVKPLPADVANGELLEISRDGRRGLVRTPDTLEVVDIPSGELVRRRTLSSLLYFSNLSPRGNRLAMIWIDPDAPTFEVQDPSTGTSLTTKLKSWRGFDRLIAFSDDDRYVAIQSNFSSDVDLALIDTMSGRQAELHSKVLKELYSVVFTDEGGGQKIIAFGSSVAPELLVSEIFEPQTGRLLARRTLKRAAPPDILGFKQGGARILISLKGQDPEKESTLWNVLTGEVKAVPYPLPQVVSGDLSRGIRVSGNGSAAQVIDFDKPLLDVRKMSAPDLLRAACRHLLYLPEAKQVEEECRPWWDSKKAGLQGG